MGRPFTSTLDIVASLVHLNLKYHNVHDEPVKVSSNLYGEKGYTRLYSEIKRREKEKL